MNPSSPACFSSSSPLLLRFCSRRPLLLSYHLILPLCHTLQHLPPSPSSLLFIYLRLNLSVPIKTGELPVVRLVTDMCTIVIDLLWNMHEDNCELGSEFNNRVMYTTPLSLSHSQILRNLMAAQGDEHTQSDRVEFHIIKERYVSNNHSAIKNLKKHNCV